ncbi:hypothetical protein ACFL0Y_00935 [Patescibacteria group bacterium]
MLFWVVLIIFILVVAYLDQIGWLQYQAKVKDRKIHLRHYFKKKEIDIDSITKARTLLKGAYATKVVQVKTGENWEDIAKITFLNYKNNSTLLNSLKSLNPNIEFSPELGDYSKAGNIGDYFINKKQIIRGLLLLLIFAFLILISYLF